MRKTPPFVYALLAFTLAGCGLFEHHEDYYPMGIGSTWTYEVHDWEMTPSGTDTLYNGTDTIKATKNDRLPTGEDVVLFIRTITYEPDTASDSTVEVDSNYVRMGGDCVLQYANKADTTVPDTVLKLPLAKDVSWFRWGARVKVTEESDVTVKAGTYRAWKVEAIYDSTYHGLSASWWFADGVGEIQSHFVSPSGIPGYTYVTHRELDRATIR